MLNIVVRHIMIQGLLFMLIVLNSIVLGQVFLEKSKITLKRTFFHLLALAGICLVIWDKRDNLNFSYIVSALSIVTMSLVFRGKVSHKLWVYVVVSDIIYTCNLFAGKLMRVIFNISNLEIHTNLLVREGLSTVLILILIKLFQDIVCEHRVKDFGMSSKRNLMILALALIYLCVIATTDYTLKNGSGIVTKSVFPLLGIYIVAIGGAWCVLMSHHSIKAVYEDKENTLQRNFFKKHLRTYAQINKIEKEQESLKQEATQGVNALLEAVDEEKLEELKPLVEKIEDKMKSCKPYIITGNTMLDMVINEKYDTACKHNVEMKVNISLPEKTGMGTVDLCMLLGNTLDYALERCERIGEEREKSISVEGVWYKGYLMFKLYYTTPKEALDKAENNSNKLIKKAIEQDPYGMGSVIKHIRKYEGELSLQECGWGEEKLTFSLNAANSYSKVFGY